MAYVHRSNIGGLSFSVSGTVLSLLDDVLTGTSETRDVSSFVITANDGDLRYLVGSTDPTATYGHVIAQGESQQFDGSYLPLMRVIAGDGTGPVNCTYSDLSFNTLS